MEFKNLPEIMAFIMKEMDRGGNPDDVKEKFGFGYDEYKEILDVMVIDKYIVCEDRYMDEMLNLDNAFITNRGYSLMAKY